MTLAARTSAIVETVWEGSAPICMARIVGDDAAELQQVDVNAISYMVVDKSDGSEVVASTSLTVANVIFDTLQTDAIWTEDSTGYNFKHQLAGTDVPDGATTYLIQYQLTDTGSKKSYVEFELTTKEQYFD